MTGRTFSIATLLLGFAMYHANAQTFTPVSNFSLSRYLGTWYEIARMPVKFEEGLTTVTATYSLGKNGKVSVVNRGVKANGKEAAAKGRAKFAGSKDQGYFKVTFFWPFYADYVIVDLDSAYTYAMVTGNSTKYLWILSRTPQLDSTVTRYLIGKAETIGYDTKKLIMVKQGSNDPIKR